jgi:hypothetical protein
MSIHWKLLSTAEKIEAVQTVWQPGMSASQIAAHFNGVTRNAVIGLYHRHAAHLADVPLKKPTIAVTAMVKAKTGKNYTVRTARPKSDAPDLVPEYIPEPSAHGWHGCGKPLMLLEAHQCKWPVNDAPVGELHLFCSMPAERSYCKVHDRLRWRR